ncbi:MAG: hypothetical protein RIQ71_2307 [Verrucomicrobiota bacterium]|jgi:hypothetical protein
MARGKRSERFAFLFSRGRICREPMDSSAGTPPLQLNAETMRAGAFLELLYNSTAICKPSTSALPDSPKPPGRMMY